MSPKFIAEALVQEKNNKKKEREEGKSCHVTFFYRRIHLSALPLGML